MLSEFTFNLPTRIEYGKGSIYKAGEIASEFNAGKVMIITDKGVRSTPLFDEVESVLKKAGLSTVVFDDVKPNPKDDDCAVGGQLAIAEKVDTIVALGGGSSMDTAKAVASLVTNPGPMADIMKPNKVKNQPIPLICIPTTAGTGSEVTSFAVITINALKRKSCIYDEKVRPKVAICDPSVLESVPPHIASATGIDALTHAIEAYTCNYATQITDAYAMQAIKLISQNLRELVYTKSYKSCDAMMMGSLLAGVAFGFSDVAGVHCLAEALGGLYDTPHGVANSIFLPVVFEFNIPADVEKHAEISEAMGISALGKSRRELAQAGADAIRMLAQDLAIPSLKDLKYVDPKDFTAMSEVCMLNVSAKSNPRPVSAQIFKELYERAYRL